MLELDDPLARLRNWRSGRDIAEVQLDFLEHFFRGDVAGNDDDDIIGPIVGLKPLMYIFETGGIEVVH